MLQATTLNTDDNSTQMSRNDNTTQVWDEVRVYVVTED